MTFVDAVRAQLTLSLDTRKPWFLLFICVLPWAFTVFILFLASRAGTAYELGPEMLISPLAALLCGMLGLVWGLLVWRDEPPQARFYHWSLPFDTSAHDLARVVAYLVWLLVGLAIYMIVGVLLLVARDVPLHFHVVGLLPFAVSVAAGIPGFLLGATFSTAFERPAEHLVGVALLVWLLGVFAVIYRLAPLLRMMRALFSPYVAYSMTAPFATVGGEAMERYIRVTPTAASFPLGPLLFWTLIAGAALIGASFVNRGRAR